MNPTPRIDGQLESGGEIAIDIKLQAHAVVLRQIAVARARPIVRFVIAAWDLRAVDGKVDVFVIVRQPHLARSRVLRSPGGGPKLQSIGRVSLGIVQMTTEKRAFVRWSACA